MINADFFTSGISPDILVNVLEDCIMFLAWVARVLLNFYLKQKQMYSGWSFNENANFSSFHGRILSGYSEINKFVKQAKTYLSKNNKNTLKKAGLKGNFKYIKAVCITRYHNKIINTEMLKQNEPK